VFFLFLFLERGLVGEYERVGSSLDLGIVSLYKGGIDCSERKRD
jgi:hypothetical protein